LTHSEAGLPFLVRYINEEVGPSFTLFTPIRLPLVALVGFKMDFLDAKPRDVEGTFCESQAKIEESIVGGKAQSSSFAPL
jgi:hypothetical protein